MNIQAITHKIEIGIRDLIKQKIKEKFWVTHYGANDIHPRHLVYWICVETDSEKDTFRADENLMKELRKILDYYEYPLVGREFV